MHCNHILPIGWQHGAAVGHLLHATLHVALKFRFRVRGFLLLVFDADKRVIVEIIFVHTI